MIQIRTLLTILLLLPLSTLWAQTITGSVVDNQNNPLPFANVFIEKSNVGTTTDSKGHFILRKAPVGEQTIGVSFIGYQKMYQKVQIHSQSEVELNFALNGDAETLSQVEVFGERYKQPEKIDAITRMPLRPSEQIQSISIISDKLIAEQGVQTITEAAQNIPGVTLFGSYGGVRESMSIRGYRGVPVLKNGVRVDSDFRTGSAMTEMQGVESVQVIKGSAAISQGLGNDLGSPGGIINVVTKTPKFTNEGQVGVRVGSWGAVSPSFDVQNVLNREQTVAVRVNGVFSRADNYRPVINSSRVYINPSLEWRPNESTRITMELDHMIDNRTPHTSTVNLAGEDTEKFYDMPHDQFLGFENDNVNNKTTSYTVRANHDITNNLSFRAAFFKSNYRVDNTSSSVSTVVNGDYNLRRRTLSRSLRDDQNSTFQLDFIGRDLYTGPFKHTFQIGFDYKNTDLSTTSYGAVTIDTINVTQGEIDNSLQKVTLKAGTPVESGSEGYGLLAQEVLSFKEYARLILGLRYSYATSITATSAGPTPGSAWNPMLGLMVSPIKNINLFASYTNTTNLRSAANIMSNGEEIGASTTNQMEFGVKSDWLDNKLRFNFTYFDIITENLSNSEYVPGTNQTTGYYYKAGDLLRSGIEVELAGRPIESVQLMLGYAYLDAHYENSPSYVNGSSPLNAPQHTANAWVQYTINKNALKGLSVGVGAYYVGARPSNDFSLQPDGHGTPVGVKPFDMPAYSTVNLQVAYPVKQFTIRAFVNNILDEVGYNAYYRGGFINQIDPRNFSCVLNYRF